MNTSTILEIIKQHFESEKIDSEVDDCDDCQEKISIPVLCSLIDEDTDIELLLNYLHNERSNLTGYLLQYICAKYPEVAKKFFEKEELTSFQLGDYYNIICAGVPKCLEPTFTEPARTQIEKTVFPFIEKFLKKYPKVLVDSNLYHPLFSVIKDKFPGHFREEWKEEANFTAFSFNEVKKIILNNFKFDAMITQGESLTLPEISLYLSFDEVIKGANINLSAKNYEHIKSRIEYKDSVIFHLEYKIFSLQHKSNILINNDKEINIFSSAEILGPWWNWRTYTKRSVKDKLEPYLDIVKNWVFANIPTSMWMNKNVAPDLFMLYFGVDKQDIISDIIKYETK